MLPTISAGIRSGVNWILRIPKMKDAAQSTEQRCFPKARNTFEQHMSAGHETNQDTIDDVLLSDYDLRNLFPYAV